MDCGLHAQHHDMYCRASGSEVATLINDYINRGAIVPVEITIGLLEKVDLPQVTHVHA